MTRQDQPDVMTALWDSIRYSLFYLPYLVAVFAAFQLLHVIASTINIALPVGQSLVNVFAGGRFVSVLCVALPALVFARFLSTRTASGRRDFIGALKAPFQRPGSLVVAMLAITGLSRVDSAFLKTLFGRGNSDVAAVLFFAVCVALLWLVLRAPRAAKQKFKPGQIEETASSGRPGAAFAVALGGVVVGYLFIKYATLTAYLIWRLAVGEPGLGALQPVQDFLMAITAAWLLATMTRLGGTDFISD